MPAVGEKAAFGGLVYEVMALDGHTIDKVRIGKVGATSEISEEP
jgi:CBS domain containing-hemolysin-like protein